MEDPGPSLPSTSATVPEASSVMSHLSLAKQTPEQAAAEALEALEGVGHYTDVRHLPHTFFQGTDLLHFVLGSLYVK